MTNLTSVRRWLAIAPIFLLSVGYTQEKPTMPFRDPELIEDALPSMKWDRIDTSHTDSFDGVFGIEVWSFPGGLPGKIKVYKRDSEAEPNSKSLNTQEIWLHFGEPVAERSLFLQSGSAYESEMTFRDRKLVAERSRSVESNDNRIPEISTASFENPTPDALSDEEWNRSRYNEAKKSAGKFLAVVKGLEAIPGGTKSLLSRAHRVLLEGISPDGNYALAWGFEGSQIPDWGRWEKEAWEYFDSFGKSPKTPVFVVSLKDGAVLGRLGHTNAEQGWTDWSPDSRFFAHSIETGHVGPVETTVYGLKGNRVSVLVPDLSAAVEEIALKELEKVKHPYYARRAVMTPTQVEEGGTDASISSISPDGVISIDILFGLHYDGTLDQADLNVKMSVDSETGTLRLVSSEIPEFRKLPLNWGEFTELISASAASWVNSPPSVEEGWKPDTAFDSGILSIYNEFGKILSPEVIEVVTKRPLHLPSQAKGSFTDIYSQFEFSRYDPIAVAEIDREVSRFLTTATVFATRRLYESKFLAIARDFNEAIRYWEENPAELKRQEGIYLQHIKNKTLPDGYYLLDGDLADRLMVGYSDDYGVQSRYLTAIRFWMRRSIDGSKGNFASILQKTIRAFDPDYFAKKGLPDLIIDRP